MGRKRREALSPGRSQGDALATVGAECHCHLGEGPRQQVGLRISAAQQDVYLQGEAVETAEFHALHRSWNRGNPGPELQWSSLAPKAPLASQADGCQVPEHVVQRPTLD